MSYSSTIFDAASNTIFDEDQKFFKGLSTLSLAHEAMNFDDIIPSSRTRGVYRRRRPRFTNYTRPRFTNHTRRPNAHLLFPPKFRDEDDDASSSCSDTSSVESIGSVESIETAYGVDDDNLCRHQRPQYMANTPEFPRIYLPACPNCRLQQYLETDIPNASDLQALKRVQLTLIGGVHRGQDQGPYDGNAGYNR